MPFMKSASFIFNFHVDTERGPQHRAAPHQHPPQHPLADVRGEGRQPQPAEGFCSAGGVSGHWAV